MPKTDAWDASRRIRVVRLMEDSAGNIATTTTTKSTSSEGSHHKQFECPLCVDVFERFSQLKWHLLSMHPRRDMIMKLVKERYGVSESDPETPPNGSLDSQSSQELPKCSTQSTEKLQPSVVTGATTRASQLPLKLRHKAVAFHYIKDRCEDESRKKSEESKMDCTYREQKMWPSDDSASWDAYLSFCLSNCVTLETVRGGQ